MIALLLIMLLLISCTKELIILIPDSDGGTITVDNMLISTPLDGVAVKSDDSARYIHVDQKFINERFGDALRVLPSSGRLFTLYFKLGGIEISNNSQPILEELLSVIREHINIVEVEVTGHTDNKGSIEDNDVLSLERARVIIRVLEQVGLTPRFVRIVGRGERDLLIKSEDERDEPLNRRVEVLVR